MAKTTAAFAMASVLLTLLSDLSSAQTQTGCASVMVILVPCMSYITGKSPAPSALCCTQLGSVVKSQPRCLCLALNSNASSNGLAVNKTQALALPRTCKLQTPPLSQCSAAVGRGAPAASPVASAAATATATATVPPIITATPLTPSALPANPAPEIPSTPLAPGAGPGSKTIPSSDGGSYKSNRSLMFPLLFFAFFSTLQA